ncbi:MAG: formyltransferase family protein [Verrucomicrobiales bacterium]
MPRSCRSIAAPAPIQAAIRDGESESGMTVMYMSEGLDEGDILLAEPVPILPDDTAAALHDRLAEVGPFALRQALDLIAAGNAPRTLQDEAAATHQPKLGREDGAIDWSDPADRIERLIRRLPPVQPGTQFTRLGGKILKIYPPTAIDVSMTARPARCCKPEPEPGASPSRPATARSSCARSSSKGASAWRREPSSPGIRWSLDQSARKSREPQLSLCPASASSLSSPPSR